MRALSVLFLTLSLIFVTSHTLGTAAQKQNEIDAWLNKISGGKPPEIDINGRWQDTQGSGMLTWGEGYLRQDQAKVNGAIGSYDIKGVVSGKVVYLIFLHKGTVYYTAAWSFSKVYSLDIILRPKIGNKNGVIQHRSREQPNPLNRASCEESSRSRVLGQSGILRYRREIDL